MSDGPPIRPAATWPSGSPAQARPGEQVEAYVARGTTTQVKAYGGEVESLTSAAVVGHRHPGGGRSPPGVRPRRHASTTSVVAETLAEARDNATLRRARRVVRPGRARRRRRRSTRTSGATTWPASTTAAKVELALALERSVLGRDPRVTGVRTAVYADAVRRGRGGHEHRGVARGAGAPRAGCRWRRWPATATRRRSAAGIDVGREPASSTSRWRRPMRSSGPCASSAPGRCRRSGCRSCSSRGWRRRSWRWPAAR